MNKILTALVAGTMMLGSTLPVCAAVTLEDTISQEAVGKDGTTSETEVTYELGSTFAVVIPKKIVLGTESKASDYTVKVYGDISSDKKVTVAPEDALEDIDGINFYMIDQASAGAKKANVQADVTQTDVDWDYTEICKKENNVLVGTTKNGNVAASKITAGNWKGVFNFNISLADAN